MPQINLRSVVIKNFQGVRNWEAPQDISPNNLFYAQNCNVQGGRFRSGKGVTKYLDALTGGTNIKGLVYFPFRESGNTVDYLLELYDGQWYAIDTDTDTRAAITGATTHTAEEAAVGLAVNNVVYLSNATDGMGHWDGTTYSTTFTGTAPNAVMLAENSGKIWCVDPAAPNIVVYSRTATAANPEYIRDFVTGSGRALITHSGYITGLVNLKDTLYVFTNQSVSFLSGFDTSSTYPIPIFKNFSVSAGAINKDCVVVAENDLFFLTPNLEVRSLGSAENYLGDPRTVDISEAIRRYLKELDPDQSEAAMTYFNKTLKLSMKTAGSPVNNWIMEYDMDDRTFAIRRMSSVKQYTYTDKQLFFSVAGDLSGQIYKDDSGYSNDGSSFRFEGTTFMADFGRPDIQKKARYVNIYLGRSINQVSYISVYKDTYDSTPVHTFEIPAPTAEEMGASLASGDATWGSSTWGGSVWGGSGISISATDEPTLYFRNFRIDTNSFGTMFGYQVFANIQGGMVEVQQITPEFIPLAQSNQVVDL